MKGSALCLVVIASTVVLHHCAPGSEPRPPNILLVSIDTLRADHLGVYGYARRTSPNLDEFADQALVFDQAYAPTPWTFPSHAAMLTGVHPYQLDIRRRSSRIPEEAPRLAAALAKADYQTAAFVDSMPGDYVGAKRGFSKGFSVYRHAPHREATSRVYEMEATVNAATRWLDQRDPLRPFFLFLHTKSVHSAPADTESTEDYLLPYDCPGKYRFRFTSQARVEAALGVENLKANPGTKYLRGLNQLLDTGLVEDILTERIEVLEALYDGCVSYVDDQLGRLFERLRELDLYDATVIIVTSDHGEAFWEHGSFLHRQNHEPLLRIPLLVRLPGGRHTGSRQALAELMDLAPTLIELAGEEPARAMTGRLLSIDAGSDAESSNGQFAYLVLEPERPRTAVSYALKRGPWRLILQRSKEDGRFYPELYSLVGGDEKRGDMDAGPGALLNQELEGLVHSPPLWRETESLIEDQETRDHLEALGYLD